METLESKPMELPQFAYLVQDNADRKRKIMSYFYKRHNEMQGAMYRPEILAYMRKEYSSEYSELEVQNDLDYLVRNKNLQQQNEIIIPKSIADYRNKNYRYQITKEAILVEKTVAEMQNQRNNVKGSLDKERVDTLYTLIYEFVQTEGKEFELWVQIKEEFRQFGENTANYIGYITSPEVDSKMKTEQFLVYKDRFVNYLREFISAIQGMYYKFQDIIQLLPRVNKEVIIEGYVKEAENIAYFEEVDVQAIRDELDTNFSVIRNWFIGSTSRQSEYKNLMDQTNLMISKVTSLIYYYSRDINQYQSTRKDYLHIAKWFAMAENIEEANKIHAGVFGLENTRHYVVNEGSNASNTREDIWELEPAKVVLSNRGKKGNKARKVIGVKLKSKEKQNIQKAHLEDKEQKARLFESHFDHDVLAFPEGKIFDAYTRKTILKWYTTYFRSLTKKELFNPINTKRIDTIFGYKVDVTVDNREQLTINFEDGDLTIHDLFIKRVKE